MSEMGDAVTMLPPRHATLRIWVEANHRSICAIASAASPPTRWQKASMSLSGAHAPSCMPSAALVHALSSGTPPAKRKVVAGWFL